MVILGRITKVLQIGLRKSGSQFQTGQKANYRLVAQPPARQTAINGYLRVASYYVLDELLHYSSTVCSSFRDIRWPF